MPVLPTRFSEALQPRLSTPGAVAPCGRDLPGPPGSGAGWARDQGPPPPQGHGSIPLAAGELRRPRPDSVRQGQGSRGWGRAPPLPPPPGQHPLCRQRPPTLPTGLFTNPGPGSEVGSPSGDENHARGSASIPQAPPPALEAAAGGASLLGGGASLLGGGAAALLWLSCSICVSSWILS